MLPATTELARRGFLDTRRALRFLSDPGLAGLDPAALAVELGATAEPDLALLGLVRIASVGVDLAAVRDRDEGTWGRLLRVVGASRWATDQLAAQPGLVDALRPPRLDEPFERLYAEVAGLVAPHCAAGDLTGGTAALRRHYRRELLGILSADLELTEADGPRESMPPVAAAISRLVGATLDGALRLAQSAHPEASAYPFSVIAMGKTGGEELNYISDVDVVYVCDGDDETAAVAATTPLATSILDIVSGPHGAEPPLWPLDANLRPEGKDGPLVRTLSSHVAYYRRWAKTWEFQALLKARPVAGDIELGRRYVEATQPLVWSAVERPNFVEDAQAMRARVEDNLRVADAERQLKLGKGGLRDVEFTVQLLQLVHGRTDETLRHRTTLTALAALATGGYVGRDHAAELTDCYRLLRALEHRIQFDRMRRSHVVPQRPDELRRLSRLLGVEDVEREWTRTRRRVRQLHEEIFYRPLLPLTARLSAEETSLKPEAATARLRAIGYRDPAGAMRHIVALTEGLSRRAAIQRHLLPVMLGWFAAGADPDAGLREFRKLSERLGSTHWYLKLLRDSGTAAERLALILASSQYCADALPLLPESIQWLAASDGLAARTPDALRAELESILSRHSGHEERVTAVRYLRRRELTRAALFDVVTGVDPERCWAMTDVADIAVQGALAVAREEMGSDEPPARVGVIAMGRMGGHEMNYSSDADLVFVYEPVADDQSAHEYATACAGAVRTILTEPNPEPALAVDMDLRPEGRHGPLVRSLASFAEYLERWSEPWEWQSLLRARPVAGDEEVLTSYIRLINPVRYPAEGLSQETVVSLRRMKARVETERLPKGVLPTRHLKLGRGGLVDVEFTAQFLQLRHAGEVEGLRTTSTQEALLAACEAELLTAEESDDLIAAWRLASRIRDANMLATGRTVRADELPKPGGALTTISRVLGYEPGRAGDLEEDWLRAARRARRVVERVFFE